MIAVDTSLAVPALISWHESHAMARHASKSASIPSHALLETYSVLTRLPQPLSAEIAAQIIRLKFSDHRVLVPSPELQSSLVAHCSEVGLTGGAVYDAYIALTAREHKATLLTRDQRASRAYRLLEVDFDLVG